jgi:hypothetical protein
MGEGLPWGIVITFFVLGLIWGINRAKIESKSNKVS